MNKVYNYQISIKSIFEPWAIRMYLHKRGYNVLIILVKLLPIYNFVTKGFHFDFNTYFNIFLFFYFELVILYRYFYFRRRVITFLGNDRNASIEFSDEKIIFKDRNSESIIKCSEITKVKETKWFIFVYKGKLVAASHYKRLMKNDDIQMMRDFYAEISKKSAF